VYEKIYRRCLKLFLLSSCAPPALEFNKISNNNNKKKMGEKLIGHPTFVELKTHKKAKKTEKEKSLNFIAIFISNRPSFDFN
jgi:hypothetical protein